MPSAPPTTYVIADTASIACAGSLLAAEIGAIGKALANPKRLLIAIVSGFKVSTKLTILKIFSAHVYGDLNCLHTCQGRSEDVKQSCRADVQRLCGSNQIDVVVTSWG